MTKAWGGTQFGGKKIHLGIKAFGFLLMKFWEMLLISFGFQNYIKHVGRRTL